MANGSNPAQKTGSSQPQSQGGAPQLSEREKELLAKLERAEAQIKNLEEEQAANASSGLKVRKEDGPFTGENGGWRFRVGPRMAEQYPHLETVEVNACDESEAIRYYCATHENPPGSKKQVDPVRVHIQCTCLSPEREKFINYQKALGTIRRKLESGSALSAHEQSILDKDTNSVLGI